MNDLAGSHLFLIGPADAKAAAANANMARLEKMAFALPVLCGALPAGLAALMGVGWDFSSGGILLSVMVIPLSLGLLAKCWGKAPAVSTILLLLGLIAIMLVEGAALALLGTRSPAPIADQWLAAVDSALPVSAMDIVRASSAWPAWSLDILRLVYVKTGLFQFVTLIALALSNREAVAWRMFVIWGGCLAVISLLAFAAPALGCFVHLAEADVAHLPSRAGTYAMEAFNNFRFAEDPKLSIVHANGVITFPSFHTVCALLIAQAWHGHRWLGWPSKLLTAAIILSCVPIGGHYLIDLAAGGVVWWIVTCAVAKGMEFRRFVQPVCRPAAVPA
nr:phosphatase PAP2 family protein [uncultured Sphingomonas sp.]